MLGRRGSLGSRPGPPFHGAFCGARRPRRPLGRYLLRQTIAADRLSTTPLQPAPPISAPRSVRPWPSNRPGDETPFVAARAGGSAPAVQGHRCPLDSSGGQRLAVVGPAVDLRQPRRPRIDAGAKTFASSARRGPQEPLPPRPRPCRRHRRTQGRLLRGRRPRREPRLQIVLAFRRA